jgi:hypothetical protein
MIHKLTSMFGPNNPHLPTEILLKIFTEEDLVYSDFFRFSCVDKEWHSFTDTNDIRKLMFLPLFESNGEIATLPPLDPVPEARSQNQAGTSIQMGPGIWCNGTRGRLSSRSMEHAQASSAPR